MQIVITNKPYFD